MNKGFRTRQGVMRATAPRPTGPYTIEWRHLQKEGQYPVEGSSVFPLIGSDEYVLMYDATHRVSTNLQEHEPERLHIRAKHEEPTATSPRATALSCTSRRPNGNGWKHGPS